MAPAPGVNSANSHLRSSETLGRVKPIARPRARYACRSKTTNAAPQDALGVFGRILGPLLVPLLTHFIGDAQ